MAKNKTRQRAVRGSGSIVREPNGVFVFWLKNPVDGKRKRHRLVYRDEATGELRNCTTAAEAERSAKTIREEYAQLDALTNREAAQLEISRTRRLINEITTKPADLWTHFLKSKTRPADFTERRWADLHRTARAFSEYCDKHLIGDSFAGMDEGTVKNFLDESTAGMANATYNRMRGNICQLFKHSWKSLGFESNPSEGVSRKSAKVTEEGHRELTEEQVRQLFAGFDGDEYRYVDKDGNAKSYRAADLRQLEIAMYFALFTGCRGGDACSMRWGNIDMVRARVTFKPRKTALTSGKVVTVPMDARLYALLDSEIVRSWRNDNEPGEDYIMPSLARRHAKSASRISRIVARLIELSTGLKNPDKPTHGRKLAPSYYGFHSLRHSFVTFAISAGISPAVVAEIVGHSSPAMTRAYTHLSDQVKLQAVEAVSSLEGETMPVEEKRRKLRDYIQDASEGELDRLLQVARTRLLK